MKAARIVASGKRIRPINDGRRCGGQPCAPTTPPNLAFPLFRCYHPCRFSKLLVEWEDGRREAVIFVLEEHTDPQRFQIHKLAHYVLDIAELYATDRIVPVTIFLRDGAPGTHLNLGTEYCTYLQFQYLACRLRIEGDNHGCV